MTEAQMFGEARAVTNAAEKNFLEIDPIECWHLSKKVRLGFQVYG